MKNFCTKATYGLAGLLSVAAFWACASGGGISGTKLVAGPIADFGSIVVNGVDFDTTNAVVTIEGDPAQVSDLRLGMYVFVLGDVDTATMTGNAERVASDHLLEGPVDGVNPAGGTFVALSQLVITDAATVFDQTTLATLAPGDVVEVFGVLDADANVRATRVQKKAGVIDFELTGTVTALDTVAETFQIGILTVDFSSALIEDAPPGGLADGLLVEVETDLAPINDLMIATSVDVLDPAFMFEEDEGAEIQGFVSAIVSTTEFVMNASQRVQTNANTRFENGDASDLVLNAQIEADGVFDAQGVLVAEEIEFVPAAPP